MATIKRNMSQIRKVVKKYDPKDIDEWQLFKKNIEKIPDSTEMEFTNTEWVYFTEFSEGKHSAGVGKTNLEPFFKKMNKKLEPILSGLTEDEDLTIQAQQLKDLNKKAQNLKISSSSSGENSESDFSAGIMKKESKKKGSKSLSESTSDSPEKATGNAMDFKEFIAVMEAWKKEAPSHGCNCVEKKYIYTTEVNYQDKQGKAGKDTIIHSYNTNKNYPEVTLTNPPSDQGIKAFFPSCKGIEPVTMEKQCGKEIALKLFEASVLLNSNFTLHPKDLEVLQTDKRYQQLKALREQGNENALKQFQEQGKTKTLGDDLPKDLSAQIKMPPDPLAFQGQGPKRTS